MSGKNITLDPSFLFVRAAGKAVKRALTEVHGNEYAVCFVAEHADAIQRAVSKRLCGRTEAQVLAAALALADRSFEL